MENMNWYNELIKPFWAPPSWVFSPVWTFLYVIIFISFGYVAYKFFKKEISFWIFLPFLLNIIFNLVFTPIQFGLRNLPLATIDIILVLGTLIWAMMAISSFTRWVALVNTPYLLWVIFATVLQITITYLNRSFFI
jgi:tryptophan-rich sensory protein